MHSGDRAAPCFVGRLTQAAVVGGGPVMVGGGAGQSPVIKCPTLLCSATLSSYTAVTCTLLNSALLSYTAATSTLLCSATCSHILLLLLHTRPILCSRAAFLQQYFVRLHFIALNGGLHWRCRVPAITISVYCPDCPVYCPPPPCKLLSLDGQSPRQAPYCSSDLPIFMAALNLT